MTTKLDIGRYRILNVAHPRDPRKYESDLVTSKILYDYMSQVDQNYMRRDRDGSLDERLDMSNHRTSSLADPTNADDAVTRRYVASRFQAPSDDVRGNKRKLDVLQNLFGVENNQVLISKYEIIDTDFKLNRWERAGEKITRALFMKHPHEPTDTDTYEVFETFTLKEYFIHVLEEPIDDSTWLRIKQSGAYTIHFDLITDSFSFELHTRGEITHFSEHNPRHAINLEKGENCLLVHKNVNTMTYSGHNVSPDYQNNIISYHNGTKYKRIEFSNGCYDYTELSDYIKETLISNCELEPDQASPITIEFDLTSFKCFVSIIKPFALDLIGSNFGALIGFEPTVIRQTQYGTDIPNITNVLTHYTVILIW